MRQVRRCFRLLGDDSLNAVLSVALLGEGKVEGPSGMKKRGTSEPRCAVVYVGGSWLRGGDLNPRPLGYEPNELPDCSTPRQVSDKRPVG